MIYISNNEKIVDIQNTQNIIVLSPKLYWFEVLNIPTKRLSKAKKIANNMLSDRPANYKDISIVKKDGKFFVYCYDRNFISSIIKKLEVNIEDFEVFFLEELEIRESLKVDESLCLIPFEDKIMENKLPKDSNLKTFETYLSSNPIVKKPLISFKIDKNKTNKLLLASNIVLGLGVISFIALQTTTLKQIDTAIQNQTIKGKSGYEIESLINSYKKKDKRKNSFKKEITNIILKNKNIDTVVYKNNKFTLSKGK